MVIDSILASLGWSPAWALAWTECDPPAGCQPARVSAQHRDLYDLRGAGGTWSAELAGRLRHQADIAGAVLPAVGDWVAAQPFPSEPRATIHAVLPRRTAFARKTPGGAPWEQVVAANVDVALLVSGLDGNFNPRRIERYLSLAYESGALPVVVLNKADLMAAPAAREAARRQTETAAPGVPVVFLSAAQGEGLGVLRDYLPAGQTAVLLGSSGVGKSTVVNALAGRELLTTAAVSDHRSLGRHTTTHRQMVELPHGGVLIDTPGMRELQLWGDAAMLGRSFASVEELFLKCRFSNCGHQGEPGCAVAEAIGSGELDPARWQSYRKQQRELAFLARKTSKAAISNAKDRWKAISKANRGRLREENY